MTFGASPVSNGIESVTPDEPVAVVGMGCRFPGGANSPEEYWRLLVERRDAIRALPKDRWSRIGIDTLDVDDQLRDAIGHGGYLADVSGFDAAFFGISDREAGAMDPQQRLLLEVTWEALEDAGIPVNGLAGSKTGVFFGLTASDYLYQALNSVETADAYVSIGGLHCGASGRLAYLWDLHGPAFSVDTACSSSLVAVNSACHSLRSGESDLAFAGGVNLILGAGLTVSIANYGMLAPDYRCKAFDASGRGYVRSEGCGVVILKRLSDAVNDGDRVHAIVRSVVANQDGRTNGITVPSAAAQRALQTEALSRAGIAPDQVGYVEAHGTGTPVGDPIEFAALAEVYGTGTPGTCALGASKTNLGHMEAAAGMGGLIKTVLCLRKGQIPGNLHFTEVNPEIDLDATRFVIPTELMGWPTEAEPRCAAVSSFGFSGTSVHAVVEQGPPTPVKSARQHRHRIFVLSSPSPAGLAARAGQLASWLESSGDGVSLGDLAYTLAGRRTHHAERLAVVADDRQELIAALRAGEADEPYPEMSTGSMRRNDRGVVFVFSGNGSGWPGMGRELLRDEPVFAETVDTLEPVFDAELGYSLRDYLECASFDSKAPTDHTQPVTFAMQAGLARVWQEHGVNASAVLGHSMGELAAGVVAGAIELRDAARVACRRARLIEERLGGTGLTALVGLPAYEVERRLVRWPHISVAVHTSPCSTVISGPPEDVEKFAAELVAEDVMAEIVGGVNFAAHSRDIDALLPLFAETLADIPSGRPNLPVYSCTLADPRGVNIFDAAYWAVNIRNTVRFAEAIKAAATDGYTTFIEVAPHPIVTRSVSEILDGIGVDGGVVLSSTRRNRPESRELLANLGRLHCARNAVDSSVSEPDGNLVDLPAVPWQRREHWLPTNAAAATPASEHPLLGKHLRVPGTPERHLWQAEISLDRLPWFAGHGTEDTVTLPSGGFCEMALSAGCEVFGTGPAGISVREMTFHAVLALNEPVTVTTSVVLQAPGEALFTVSTGADRSLEHATARIRVDTVSADQPTLDAWPQITAAPEPIYDRMAAMGVCYDAGWRAVTAYASADSGLPVHTAIGRLRLPEQYRRGSRQLRLSPVLFDGCLQVLLGAAAPETVWEERPDDGAVFFVTEIGSMQLFGNPADGAVCRVRFQRMPGAPTANSGRGTKEGSTETELPNLAGAVELFDDAGRALAAVEGIRFAWVGGGRVRDADRLFGVRWEPCPLQPAESEHPGGCLALTEEGPDSQITREALEQVRQASFSRLLTVGCRPFDETVFCVDGPLATAFAEPAGTWSDILVLPPARDADDRMRAVDPERLLELAADRQARLARLVQLILDRAGEDPPRLWVLTSGAENVLGDERPAPEQAPMVAYVRTLKVENPELRPIAVDLDNGPIDLGSELASGHGELQIAYRDGVRYRARLDQVGLDESCCHEPVVRAAHPDREAMRWDTIDRRPVLVARGKPAARTVQISVEAVAVQADEMVCVAGTISAVGARGTVFRHGDRVAAVARGPLESFTAVPENWVTALPAEMTAAEAVAKAARFDTPQEFRELADLRGDLTRKLLTAVLTSTESVDTNDHATVAATDLTAGRNFERSATTIVELRPGTEIPSILAEVPFVRPGGGYLITGGLGWLGRCAARYLADRGAGCVVLNARGEPNSEAAVAIAEMRASGVDVRVVRGDIGDPVTAPRLVDALQNSGAPLCGVLHAAGVLNDAAVWNLGSDQIRPTWRTKAAGAWWLHTATAAEELDWFVLFSSMAALLPGPGQANHAAACAYLDAFASWRRAQGLPATAIGWGAWAEFGQGAHMAGQGLTMIDSGAGMAAFERIVRAGSTRIAYTPLDFAQRVAPHRALAESHYVAGLSESDGAAMTADGSRLLSELDGCQASNRRDRLESFVIDQARAVLRIGDSIDRCVPMTAYGLDSLTSMELRVRLEAALRIRLPATFAFAHPTPAALAENLVSRLDRAGA
jgi:acyl transferase domain-containing protein/NAD(P)-dependent dehydrogenase (short-subunit alcohol dehydrogenase family)/acyl carrier protein